MTKFICALWVVVIIFTSGVLNVEASTLSNWDATKTTLANASVKSGLDVKYLAIIGFMESGFRTDVRHSDSSAVGLFQFTQATWRRTLKTYGSKYGLGANTARTDPLANAIMAAEYMLENGRYLRKHLKVTPTLTDIYLSHLLAPRRAVNLRRVPPNVNIVKLYPRLARANPGLFYRHNHPLTVGEFRARINKRIQYADRTYTAKAEEVYNTLVITDTYLSTAAKTCSVEFRHIAHPLLTYVSIYIPKLSYALSTLPTRTRERVVVELNLEPYTRRTIA